VNKEIGMNMVKTAVIVAVFVLAPCLALSQEQKAPASQPKCPYLKAQAVTGDQAKSCCPAKADAADKSGCAMNTGDKAACKVGDTCKKDAEKVACKTDGACKKDADKPACKVGDTCKKDADKVACKTDGACKKDAPKAACKCEGKCKCASGDKSACKCDEGKCTCGMKVEKADAGSCCKAKDKQPVASAAK
jgi:hypothetical protein